jgi:cell division protein FtsA
VPDNELVVALDVGTTKICALVAEIDPLGGIHLLGVGQSASAGLRKGIVIDIVTAGANIREAIEAASRVTGIQISSVVVGVTGQHVSCMNVQGAASITHLNKEITEHDVYRVMESARTVSVPAGREVIHLLPRGFAVDGQSGVWQPVGMSGQRLEVETHVITGQSSFLQNVAKSVEQAGLLVETMVLEPIATSEAVLSDSEKELGAVVVDIGGGTTDIAVVIEGAVAYSAVIPVGGNHVTNDLAVGLKTGRAEAERLKKDYGCALASLVADDDLLAIGTVDGSESRSMSRRAIADVIEPRMQELLGLVKQELAKSGFEERLSSAVLSGGGSLLHGTPELAETILALPTRIGRPRRLAKDGAEIDSPVYATAVGLLYFGAARQARVRQEHSTGNFLQNAWEQLRGFFARLVGG